MAIADIQREELGKQQVKSLRAREAICDATIQCLIDHGYEKTSLNRVAALAGFSKGAVQHHFPTKEDLIAATADRLLERPFMQEPRPQNQPKSVEESLLLQWKRLINTDPYRALLEILNATRTDRELQVRIRVKLKNWRAAMEQQALKRYRAKSGKDEDVKIITTMTRSLMRGLVIEDQYAEGVSENLRYVERWIEIVAPLLELRNPEQAG